MRRSLLLLVGAALASACATEQKPAAPAAAALPAPSMAAAAPALAAAPVASAPAPAPAPETTFAHERAGQKTHRLVGSLQSADASAHTLVVAGPDGQSRTFKVLSDTKFDKGGNDAPVTFSGLRAGDRVRVTYVGDFAGSVHVLVTSATKHG